MKDFTKTIKRKAIIASIATVAGVSVSSLTFASDEPAIVPSSTSSAIGNAAAAVGGALKEISTTIQANAMALAHKTDALIYQLDANLAPTMKAVSADQNITQTTREAAQTTTEDQVKNALWAFPEKIVTPDTSTQDGSEMNTNKTDRANLYRDLTVNAPASDTLYIDSDSISSSYPAVAKPDTTYNNYFSFDTLFTPKAYANDDASNAAQKYVEYAAELYSPLTDGINYSGIQSGLSAYSSDADKANYLQKIVTNATYQKYQLSIRSLVAARSAAVSNFNYMQAERTPVADLGTKAGMPDDPNLPSGSASPLQVQHYVGTHRVNNPDWYTQMKHASPATLQREQVFMLAEIEAQMQRSYMLNERVLSTLSVMGLQAGALQKMSLQSQANDVNQLISPTQTGS